MAKAEIFQKLQHETKLKLPFFHEETDICEMEKVQIPIVGVIVIEGVFLQRKEWRDFFIIWSIWTVQERQGFYVRVKKQKTFQSLKIGIGKQRIIT